MRWEQCGARCTQIHETTVRRVRDLPLFEYRVVLHVPRLRVWCDRCSGPRPERLDALGRDQRATERFARACEKLLQAAQCSRWRSSMIWVGTRSNRRQDASAGPSCRAGLVSAAPSGDGGIYPAQRTSLRHRGG
ncbi:transposase family protein [Caballeronia sp. LP003]|nr:transposase family protein [Caballeronia sp. LP003]MDR5785953.1 transposase family protein [Caballeronia sp. LP003]